MNMRRKIRDSAFGSIVKRMVPGNTTRYTKPNKPKKAAAPGYKRRPNKPSYKVPKTPKNSGRNWGY